MPTNSGRKTEEVELPLPSDVGAASRLEEAARAEAEAAEDEAAHAEAEMIRARAAQAEAEADLAGVSSEALHGGKKKQGFFDDVKEAWHEFLPALDELTDAAKDRASLEVDRVKVKTKRALYFTVFGLWAGLVVAGLTVAAAVFLIVGLVDLVGNWLDNPALGAIIVGALALGLFAAAMALAWRRADRAMLARFKHRYEDREET